MGGISLKIGEVFGDLTTIEMVYLVGKSGRKRSHWRCKCSCGAISVVDSGNLRNGNTQRCTQCAKAQRGLSRATHGQAGNRKTKLYETWAKIKSRVSNPNDKRFSDYGGRGIDMDPRWSASFQVFASEVGTPPSGEHQIDRIDNNKGYWPSNVRWSDRYEQSNNKRNNIVIEWHGIKQTLSQWCRDLSISFHTAKARHYRHPFDAEKIFAQGRLRSGSAYNVDGKRFATLAHVAETYGLSTSGCHARFNSPAFPSWKKVKP